MAMLARTQERDLRAWLYGRAPSVPGVRLRDALDAMAGRIERQPCGQGGDGGRRRRGHGRGHARPGGGHQRGHPGSTASHSGAAEVSVYVEVEADAVAAWCTTAAGFDPDTVPPDRRDDSIVARMQRHGGSAEVVSGADGRRCGCACRGAWRRDRPRLPGRRSRAVPLRGADRAGGAATPGWRSWATPARSARRCAAIAPRASRTWCCWTCTCRPAAAARC